MYLHLFTVTHLLSCSVGIALAVFPTGFLAIERHIWLISVLSALVSLCLIVYRRCGAGHNFYSALIVLLCGFLWGLYFTHITASSILPSSLDDQMLLVEGKIVGLPRHIESYKRKGQQFDMAVSDSRCINSCIVPDLQILRLRWYGGERVSAGQRWQFIAKLRRPRGLSNFAGRDYEVWMVQQGISATGSIVQGKRLSESHGLQAWREAITLLLEQQLQKYSQRGILQALINGNNAAINNAQWDIFSATNTTHLFVISGLHLSLMGGLLWWIFRRCLLLCGMPSARSVALLAAIFAWIFAAIYAFLAGWAVPVQRALAVFTLLLIVFLVRRSFQPLHTFVLLLTICLFLDPLVLLSISFWLSWSAAAVLLFALTGRKRFSMWHLWWRSQWAITLGLAPLMILVLGQISLLGLLANALAIPLVNLVIVPLNLLSLLLYFISPTIAHYLWRALNFILDYLLIFLHELVEIGGVLIWHPSFHWSTFLLLVIAIILLLMPKGFPGKPLSLLCLLPCFFSVPARVPDNELHMTIFDVGQGLAVLIRVSDKVLLYDTGPKLGETSDAGEVVILPYFYQQGISHIDHLIISHADMDHAGGLSSVLKTITVGEFLAGEDLDANVLPPGKSVDRCRSEDRWQWQQFGFEFIHPPLESGFSPLNKSGNNRSCVLRIYQHNTGDIQRDRSALALLPGDIERPIEYQMLRDKRNALRSELLIVPHHGSRTSSSTAFVKAVAPSLAIVSSGYRHRFGHPHREIVQRYHQQGTILVNTADTGALSLVWRDGKWHIDDQARQNSMYFWQ